MSVATSMLRPASLADAADLASVHIDSWRSTYRGILPQDYLDRLEDRTPMWTRILGEAQPFTHTWVAINPKNEQIIGFSNGGPARGSSAQSHQGEIYAIYLLESCQGLGLGRQLFEASRRHFQSDGLSSFMLWVLEENPSCGFYQKMGGERVNEAEITIGGRQYKELMFGWGKLSPDAPSF